MDIPACCRSALTSPMMRVIHHEDARIVYPNLTAREIDLYVELQMNMDLAEHLRLDHGAKSNDLVDLGPLGRRTLSSIEGRIIERMNMLTARHRRPATAPGYAFTIVIA